MIAVLRLALAALMAILLTGCSLWSGNGEDTPPPADASAASQRPALEATADSAEALRDPAARELRRIQQEIRQLKGDVLDAQLMSQATSRATRGDRPGPTLGLLLGEIDTPLRIALEKAFSRVAADHAMSFTPTAALGTALQKAGCSAESVASCLDTLAISHGVRMLARVEHAGSAGGRQRFRVQLIDTELDIEHPAFTVTAPATDGRIPQPALEALADDIYLHARARLGLAPQIVHALLSVENTWVLNQGRAAGLEAGQRLIAYSGGQLVADRSDEPVAWLPGQRTGLLEITGFTPNGLALARLVDGQAPQADYPLVPQGG